MALVRNTAAAPPAAAEGLDALLARLADPDREQRRRAALDLGATATETETELAAALAALLARVDEEADPIVRDALLVVLAGHDDLVVAQALVTHLHSDDPGLRIAVVEALSTMPHAVPPMLPVLVVDPDPRLRILTAVLLGNLVGPETLPWLVEMIAEDPDPSVVATAIDALLPHLEIEHVGLLRATRARFPDDPFLHFIVHSALARWGG